MKSIKLYRAIDYATAFRYISGNFSWLAKVLISAKMRYIREKCIKKNSRLGLKGKYTLFTNIIARRPNIINHTTIILTLTRDSSFAAYFIHLRLYVRLSCL